MRIRIWLRNTAVSLTIIFPMLLLPKVALADTDSFSGNYWYEICLSNEQGSKGMCLGYVMGLIQLENLKNVLSNNIGKIYCSPENVTNRQAIDIFLNYLKNNPTTRNGPAPMLFELAMMQSFPCPKS